MIIAKTTDSKRIEPLHPLFKKLFEYVKANDLLNKEIGRIELQGDDLFINNSEPTLVTREKQALEVHQKYIDVHFPLNGVETIGWKSIRDLSTSPLQPFDEEKDFAFYDERPSTYFELHPGEFMVVYPEDAHAPIIGKGTLRKLVAKIKLTSNHTL